MDLKKFVSSFVSGSNTLKVDSLSETPDKAWEKYKKNLHIEKVDPLSLIHTRDPDKYLRFVCISDTHCNIEKKEDFVPEGDVLLHAGDFSNCGRLSNIKKFNDFLGSLPHQYKIVIAGNHDISFDTDLLKKPVYIFKNDIERDLNDLQVESGKAFLTNCTYLEDSYVDIHGYKIYGSPWQPRFCDWAFNVPRGKKLLDKWNLIPDDVDILITHGPPLGYGDLCRSGLRAGCVDLLNTIQKRVQPKFHVFGHIHEDYGILTNKTTTFINASSCSINYCLTNPPIVFDLPLYNSEAS
ncbi:metallophosphoesterase domain-containing protein 1-like isoform X1 [Octopus vulgaris]|uniref:Metallophosphoesterase domain-containing protein 1-like isoform X1 n=1 Tax=Octopus vulgaris TaxID=6645 RepID=A0AA36FEX4_OCTVU|nr:metallophosphoesterase domain-containing protein 1-like isoform X1 [Octopus vulgaris]